MATSKRLKSDTPYAPTAGIDPDGNGLSLRAQECATATNLRFFQKDISTRGGSNVLAFNTPSADPILHVHNYKAPNGQEKLFGFTKNSIYMYNPVTKYWLEAWESDNSLTLDTESSTSWDSMQTRSNGTIYSGLGASVYSGPLSPIDGTKWIGPTDLTSVIGFGLDTPNYTATLELVYTFDAVSDLSVYDYMFYNISTLIDIPNAVVNLPITFISTTTFLDATDTLLAFETGYEITYNTIEEVVRGFGGAEGSWKRVNVTKENFGASPLVKKIKFGMSVITGSVDVYGLALTGQLFALDYVKFGKSMLQSGASVSFWHTTDFIDSTKGSTIVACGSNPPAPGAEEVDAGSRVMYYYDTADSNFKELNQKHTLSIIDESTNGAVIPTAAGIATISSTRVLQSISATKTLDPGSFSVYTVEKGVIATSASVEGTFAGAPGYALIPIDSTYCIAGSSSYVLKDGSAWKLKINNPSAQDSTLALLIRYDYEEELDYKPRFVWVLNNRLMMANTYEDSYYQVWRARWSEIADIFSIRGIDYADLIDTDTSPIVGGDYQSSNLVIYKTNSISRCHWVGDPLTFNFETVFLSGTYAGKTVKAFNHKHYYLGSDDVYVWDGSVATSITMDPERGNYRVRDKIFSILNNTRVHYCMGNIYPKYQEYWLWIVKTGENYPKSVFVYNMVRGIWSYFEFSATTCVALYTRRIVPVGSSGLTYDALQGYYQDQNWRFEGGYLDGTVQAPILALEAGNVNVIDDSLTTDGGYVDSNGTYVPGTLVPVSFVSRDFTLGDISYQKRWNRLNFEATGATVDVGYADTYEMDPASFLGKVTIPLDSTNQERHYFPDLVNETIRFSFEASGSFSLRWLQPQGIELEYENE